jgi:hypothetical protein
MASVSRHPETGIYRIQFRYGGRQFQKSLGTTKAVKADAMKAQVEETLPDLLRGRLTLPSGADLWVFLRSGGKFDKKPELPKLMTLGRPFELCDAKLTEGAKEASTRRVERIHAAHLKPVLGPGLPLESLGAAALQGYIDRRAKDARKGRPIKARSIRKELDTLRAVWAWARHKECTSASFPTGPLTYPKEAKKPPFQTWDEIERAVARGACRRRKRGPCGTVCSSTAARSPRCWSASGRTRARPGCTPSSCSPPTRAREGARCCGRASRTSASETEPSS